MPHCDHSLNQHLFASYPDRTPTQVFTQIVSDFGTQVQNAGNEQHPAANTLQSLTPMKSAITGVSINQELTNFIQYQTLMQASGHPVQAANDNITFLIQNIN